MALRLQSPPACLPPLPLEPAGRPQSPSLPLPLPIHRPKEALPRSALERGLQTLPPAPRHLWRGQGPGLGPPGGADCRGPGGPGANQRSYLSSSAEARTSQDQFTFFGLGLLEPEWGGRRGPRIHRTHRQGLGHPTRALCPLLAATATQPGVPLAPPPNACALSTCPPGSPRSPVQGPHLRALCACPRRQGPPKGSPPCPLHPRQGQHMAPSYHLTHQLWPCRCPSAAASKTGQETSCPSRAAHPPHLHDDTVTRRQGGLRALYCCDHRFNNGQRGWVGQQLLLACLALTCPGAGQRSSSHSGW